MTSVTKELANIHTCSSASRHNYKCGFAVCACIRYNSTLASRHTAPARQKPLLRSDWIQLEFILFCWKDMTWAPGRPKASGRPRIAAELSNHIILVSLGKHVASAPPDALHNRIHFIYFPNQRRTWPNLTSSPTFRCKSWRSLCLHCGHVKHAEPSIECRAKATLSWPRKDLSISPWVSCSRKHNTTWHRKDRIALPHKVAQL